MVESPGTVPSHYEDFVRIARLDARAFASAPSESRAPLHA
jgi:hypothetical protein